MTIIDYILPMTKPRRVLLILYDGFELLDVSGPASVFAAANNIAGETHYELRYLSAQGGPIDSIAGASLNTQPLQEARPIARDTVLVAGGEPVRLGKAMQDKTLLQWLQRAAPICERMGSVCSGAFILAEAGLLDHRAAVTHWLGCEEMRKRYPNISVREDALYVVDEHFWTSAGVTTGIDMSLAILARDHGEGLMGQVAKRLVVYACRPGNQSQFSDMLSMQLAAGARFSKVIAWLENNIDKPLRVEDMAKVAGMSERSFYRKFTAALNLTPSQCLDMMRLERARTLLESQQSVSAVSRAVGYQSEAAFRTSFKAKFGLSPSQHAAMHKGQAGVSSYS